MYFFLNGQQYYTKQNFSILELIKYFNYDTSLLVLEYNNFIYNKEKWTNTFIKDKDNIEIITIVGGG